VKTAVLLALLLAPATLSAQEDEFYALRWTAAFGPSSATPSGNKLKLSGAYPTCFTCGRNFQRVVGANDSRYHASLNVAGDIRFNLTIRGELNYSHATSLPSKLPPRECPPPGIYKCYQDRKSLVDNAWYLGGGLEWTPFKKIPVMPYVAATGGLTLNAFRWNWDTTGTNSVPTMNAQAFGAYMSGGFGASARVKSVLGFFEARRFINFSTPGTAMISYSLGVQYWLRFRNYGY
jgi:hypothetical protein